MPVEMSRANRPSMGKKKNKVQSFSVDFVENGVTVRVTPKPKEDKDGDGVVGMAWDPGKQYVFKSFEEAAEFMTKCVGGDHDEKY